MYVRYVVPHWREHHQIPDEVRAYVRAHHGTINDHRGWLTDQLADWLLSL